MIIAPFMQNYDINSEAWIVNAREITCSTRESDLIKASESLNEESIVFDIKLKGVKFQYVSKIRELMNSLRQNKNLEEDLYWTLIDDFAVEANLTIYNEQALLKNRELAAIEVRVDFEGVKMKLSNYLYGKLINIGDCFIPVQNDENLEIMYNERTNLIARAELISPMNVFTGKDWKKYVGIVSGNFIYLFENVKDLYSKESISLRSCAVNYLKPEEYGRKCVFQVNYFFSRSLIALDRNKGEKNYNQHGYSRGVE